MKDSSFFIDEIDHLILMHKDVHFGGNFKAMIAYYEQDFPVGIQEEFNLHRIQELEFMEANSPTPLSDLILDEVEKQEIQRAKESYQSLIKLCDLDSSPPQKLALLILSEKEEPKEEIEDLCSLGKEAVLPLLTLIRQEDFYNPLFPGYGLSPFHAATCLGKLKAKEAIIPLFEMLPRIGFFGELEVFSALASIGDPAKEFLLKVLKKTPLTQENENAAIALSYFLPEPMIASACIDMLELPSVQANLSLFTHLLFSCEKMTDPKLIERVSTLLKTPLPLGLKKEITNVFLSFKKDKTP